MATRVNIKDPGVGAENQKGEKMVTGRATVTLRSRG